MIPDLNRIKMYVCSTSFLLALLFSSIFAFSEEVPYGTGGWNVDVLGNYRAVLQVSEKTEAVWAHIPWRRRDFHPDKKQIIVVDARTGTPVKNVCPQEVTRAYGDVVFEPVSGPGEYYVYYLPYKLAGRTNYPSVQYLEPEQTADVAWLERNRLIPGRRLKENSGLFPRARVLEFQSVDEFSSCYPMEVIATEEEVKEVLSRYPQESFLLFPEDRKYPIRMTDDLPYKWIQSGPQDVFSGAAARGEFYAFQVGVYACREAIKDIDVRFAAMKHAEAQLSIPASSFTCFNLGGVNWNGEEIRKVCPVEQGKVYPLWCGVQVPLDCPPGLYEGEINIVPKDGKWKRIKFQLNVSDEILEDAGDSETWRHSRLRWLNSRIAFDDEVVTPFASLVVRDNEIRCLGRSVTIGQSGLPVRIQSFFAPEVTHLIQEGRDLLSGPIRLVVEDVAQNLLVWKTQRLRFTKNAPGAVTWEIQSQAGPLNLDCQARMEFDGSIEFRVRLSASKALDVRDIRLEIPFLKDVARYMMGLGLKGGLRPSEFKWVWDQKKNQDALWIGDVNAGLQCSWRADNYSRPLNTNFYLSKPLNMPPSWYNEGRGGCTVKEVDSRTVLLTAYSGPRVIRPGEELCFYFNLLLTPFKTIDTRTHWTARFFHAFKSLDEVARTGANTINVHHANDINPYINYPFLRPKEMKDYIDGAHSRGFKVKIYYTIRELSNRAAELFALRSLGNEIFSSGPGGGYSWLQEHLGSDYIAAWFV
ncbi:MAG: glycoside hydrolase domain-containing protein, partial [Candidatus Aminicenantales bacterium]